MMNRLNDYGSRRIEEGAQKDGSPNHRLLLPAMIWNTVVKIREENGLLL
jgi:hypothetical protein